MQSSIEIFGWKLSELTRQAFGSTFETENAQPLSSFSTTLGNSTVLGAFRNSKLVAIAGFAVHRGQKMAHKGVIWGMYVQPSARRGRIGRQLVEAILDLARQRVELIQLTVVRDNEQARRLYTNLGFLEYGIEKNALKQNGRYYDEILNGEGSLGKIKLRRCLHRIDPITREFMAGFPPANTNRGDRGNHPKICPGSKDRS